MFPKGESTPTLSKRRVITSEPQFPKATGYDKDNLSEKKDWESLYVDEQKCHDAPEFLRLHLFSYCHRERNCS